MFSDHYCAYYINTWVAPRTLHSILKQPNRNTSSALSSAEIQFRVIFRIIDIDGQSEVCWAFVCHIILIDQILAGLIGRLFHRGQVCPMPTID
jgi:hypothetical protein